jgi:hypothetical protein
LPKHQTNSDIQPGSSPKDEFVHFYTTIQVVEGCTEKVENIHLIMDVPRDRWSNEGEKREMIIHT